MLLAPYLFPTSGVDVTALARLQTFVKEASKKLRANAAGEPEDQLRSPFEAYLSAVGRARGVDLVLKGESAVDRLGRPDYAVLVDGIICGYVELKAPGKGADPKKYKGHDKKQWNRFKAIPNVLYSDGNEWRLFQESQSVGSLELPGVLPQGAVPIPDDASTILEEVILARFLGWQPIVPTTMEELARVLAPICRTLRDDVVDALKDETSSVHDLARDWRDLLFPQADDQRFADAYAQTVTFALLIARAEGAQTTQITDAVQRLKQDNSLLSRALEVLTDDSIREDIGPSISLLQRVCEAIDPVAVETSTPDPWLYFYEDFLSEYDAKLKRDYGAYYTPVEVVKMQARFCDELLKDRLGLPLGFSDPDVVTLDPAVGTGTYPLGVIDHASADVAAVEGRGAVPERMTELAGRLFGFEIMTGPYAVAELRIRAQFLLYGASLEGTQQVYLTNTLESPKTTPPAPPLFLKPIAKEHAGALKIKDEQRVFVCLGNPPYDRHKSGVEVGNWVRYGSEGDRPILADFSDPVKESGKGHYLKNLYNLYVYFWRWAIWKVFEHDTAQGPAVISFITASSFLHGDAFLGFRKKLREEADDIWVVDLGGEGRGTRQDQNVFSIRTPVTITTVVRYGEPKRNEPATSHYFSLPSKTRARKLRWLNDFSSIAEVDWTQTEEGWTAPLVPTGRGRFFSWPTLHGIFPWHHSGAQVFRTWPVSPNPENLEIRWRGLLEADSHADQAKLFRESRDRKIGRSYIPLEGGARQQSISALDPETPSPPIVRYGWRTLDSQWILADSRLGDYLRPVLWPLQGPGHLFLVKLTSAPVGKGPALSASAYIPDYHYFCNRGGKDAIPLWRDADQTIPNIASGLLETLSAALDLDLTPADLAGYVFGVLSSPYYTEEFFEELARPDGEDLWGPRVPITKDSDLFREVRQLGGQLLAQYTGEEFLGSTPAGSGQARNTVPITTEPDSWPNGFSYDPKGQELKVGGGAFAPVSPGVWEHAISGYATLQSWLDFRTGDSAGKRSSDLDEIQAPGWSATTTRELLALLWRLEQITGLEARQAELIRRVLDGDLFTTSELPAPQPGEEDAPATDRDSVQLDLL